MALATIQPELHQRILDNLSLAVMLFKPDLTLIYANPAAEMLLGVSVNRLIGLPFEERRKAEVSLKQQLVEAVDTNHPFSRHELAVRLMNENDITVDLTVNILQSGDVEKQVLLEMEPIDRILRIAREDAIVAQQATAQDLIRGLAHEIKNPLGGLRGAAQLLERELESDDQKEYTKVIIDEADRLQKLVNRLLGPSGMPKKSEINVHEAIEYVRGIVLNDKPEIHFVRDYDPSIPNIVGDQDLLVQAILNIVNNAIDVIDEGPGIPEEIKDKIFFPMITGRAEGTGLGLSIAQRLVTQHSGLIECTSEPGKTIFSIYLPVDNADGDN